ncbi:segregation and condensation protein B [Clostridium tetani]|uniref:Segregation and condensation protein B n=1 Tax=Clostridium tetani TaxID=1513 RepID=A0ABY0ELG5_CLOTA|nr:SMC-Scp complex subunit ScpB [Clostridium tetani]KHO38948.1 segregation and condensation protein B [Clostridium tetani]RXI38046.1 segregation/condensation protein B [Clostridium tetani]RXI52398.1 segregation/condensation protein B [Clostridium tetani]RXI70037.1 segregation/condensation protein B [Clostridium tetani]
MKQMNYIINEENELRFFSIIESLLFASGEPLSLKDISEIIELNTLDTKEILQKMIREYEIEKRGIKLIEIEKKYQLVTKEENSCFIEQLLKTNSSQSISQAALETLSIVAYKQPVTRVDVDEIRGVKSDRALQTLLQKSLIKETGRLDVPGRPILYSTTEEFLKHFGLESIKELPSLEELLEEFQEEDIVFNEQATVNNE